MGNCIVTFSARKGGNCAEIGTYIKELHPDRAELIAFSELAVAPCGRCAYECFRDNTKCPHIGDSAYGVYETISHSDLAYFIVPNYCDFPCANYFAFNERRLCYFQGHDDRRERYEHVRKKFIVLSNAGRENFRIAFSHHVAEGAEPQILFLSAKSYGKSSIDGDLISSGAAKDDIRNYLLE